MIEADGTSPRLNHEIETKVSIEMALQQSASIVMVPYQPKTGNKEYTPIPEGTYMGTFSRVMYFGTHNQIDQKTGNSYEQQKISLTFEIDYRSEEGAEKNRMISTGYPITYSLSSKSRLTKLVRPWLASKFPAEDDPMGLNFDEMMDMPVMVSVINVERKNKEGKLTVYDEISGLSMPPKGMPKFNVTQDKWIWSILFDLDLKQAEELRIPNFLIEFAKDSKEYRENKRAADSAALDRTVAEVFDAQLVGVSKTPPASNGDDFVF